MNFRFVVRSPDLRTHAVVLLLFLPCTSGSSYPMLRPPAADPPDTYPSTPNLCTTTLILVGASQEGVPYITAEPAVTTVELTPNDRFLVLATDGVWEQVSNEEAVRCVSGALGGSGSGRRPRSTASRAAVGGGGGSGGGGGRAGSSSYTSDALVDLVLARSAQSHGMSVPALRALPRGSSRRVLHDDVCATVVHFSPPPPRPPPL